MADTDTVSDEARRMAAAHYDLDESVMLIFRINGPDDGVNRLLQVNRDAMPKGVQPLGFGPAPDAGYHHPSVITEVSPEEALAIQAGELFLPHGWKLGKPIPREVR